METVLETPRFILREFAPEDAEALVELNADEEVIKYTGDSAFENKEEALKLILNYEQYKRYGCGRWSVIGKTDKQFFGWCGIKFTPEENVYDIGFRFYRKHWNKGIATETAQACIRYGFNKLGLDSMVGRVMKKNLASIRVLKKIGMFCEKEFNFNGEVGLLFKIQKVGN